METGKAMINTWVGRQHTEVDRNQVYWGVRTKDRTIWIFVAANFPCRMVPRGLQFGGFS